MVHKKADICYVIFNVLDIYCVVWHIFIFDVVWYYTYKHHLCNWCIEKCAELKQDHEDAQESTPPAKETENVFSALHPLSPNES